MKPKLPLAERDRRMASLRQETSEARLDALLFAGKGHYWTGRGSIRYLTDFHLWAHDALLLLPVDGAPAMTVNSHGVAQRVAERGWLEDVRGDYRLVRGIADAIREKGLTQARVGLVGFQWILPAGVRDDLAAMLPDVTFLPADGIFNAVRTIKSPLEIEQCRQLWPVMRASMARFQEALSPGITQREAVAAAVGTATAMGAREVLAFIGERPDEYAPPENVAMRCDDVVRLHLEICGESGHWCERTMTFAYRNPTPPERLCCTPRSGPTTWSGGPRCRAGRWPRSPPYSSMRWRSKAFRPRAVQPTSTSTVRGSMPSSTRGSARMIPRARSAMPFFAKGRCSRITRAAPMSGSPGGCPTFTTTS